MSIFHYRLLDKNHPMDQSKDYTLNMCKSDIKKIGHNFDTTVQNYSAAVYSEQQVSMVGNLSLTQPLFEDQFSLQNKSHFETLSTLTTTYYIKKTLWNSSVNYSNSKNNTTLTFKVGYKE